MRSLIWRILRLRCCPQTAFSVPFFSIFAEDLTDFIPRFNRRKFLTNLNAIEWEVKRFKGKEKEISQSKTNHQGDLIAALSLGMSNLRSAFI